MRRSEMGGRAKRRDEGCVLTLAKPLERAVSAGHPWIYRDALRGTFASHGAVATVLDRKGRFLARGVIDQGPIGVRVWTTADEPVDAALVARRVTQAAALRDRVVPADTNAYRLLHGEGDRLPGVVCDVYGAHAVLRFDGAGAPALRALVVDALLPTLRARGVTALLEKGARADGAEVTAIAGALPDAPVRVLEHGMTLVADLVRGQKTGLFLDHRESRRAVRALAKGARVLNLYGYTGGFSVAAGLGGATHVETVDIAAPAIAMAELTWRANELDPARHVATALDAPARLDALAKERARFDVIVADPPSFAPKKDALESALASYEKLHAACLALTVDGGYYLAASCSSHVRRSAFDDTLRDGARKARRVIQILGTWGAPADHPRLAAFPEGDYLKITLARVVP